MCSLRRKAALIRCVLAIGAGGCLVSCGSSGDGSVDAGPPTAPLTQGPALRIVAGAGVTDTVDARLAHALQVEVRDSTGALAANRMVRFQTVREPDGRYHVLAGPSKSPPYSNITTVPTDASGRASVQVVLGTALGHARLAVSVSDLGLADTVGYDVLPGAADHILLATSDTAVTPGAAYPLGATLRDRYDHVAPGSGFTYASSPGIQAVTSLGQVTVGEAIARAQVIVAWRALAETAYVSVVPRMRFLVYRSSINTGYESGLLSVESDNTGAQMLDRFGDAPHAVSARPDVVFSRGNDGGGVGAGIWITTAGEPPRELVSGTADAVVAWPRFSPDGSWVYFVISRYWDRSVWRVHPDGTGLDSLGAFENYRSNAMLAPGISPDGRTVVVDEDGRIKFFNVAARTSRSVTASCMAPRYSPDGAFIACSWQRQLRVLSATDGSLIRIVPYDTNFVGPYADEYGADWTPDGKWLVAYVYGEGLALVDAPSGARIPIVRPFGVEDRYPSVVR